MNPSSSNAPALRASAASQAFVSDVRADGTGPVWIHLTGELDICSAPRLAVTLRQTEWWPLVILDLRDLAFLDSAGVHVIVNASARAQRPGQRLILVRGSAQVDRMLTLSGVSHLLTIIDLE